MGLTDKMIWDRARLFATSIGISESHFKANSQGWLEKFKQKNHLIAKADGEVGALGGPNGRARSASSVDVLASPMAVSRSQDSHYTATQHDSPDSFLDWASGGSNYKHAGSSSVSSTSLSSMFTDHGVVASPTSPFFSPDGQTLDSGRPSPAFPARQGRMPQQMRPRSQTFPLISVDSTYISPPSSSDPLTPKLAPQAEMPEIDPALSNPAINGTDSIHNSLASSQANVGPSKEDAKRALALVVDYLRQQPVGILLEPDEYLSMTKLLGRFGLNGPEGEHGAMLGLSS